jgi:hypothetical protein
MGYQTVASGDYSTATGYYTDATGPFSFSSGGYTLASGELSTAMGFSTVASGIDATAMGASTTASGNYSTAMGASTLASADASTATGGSTTASGYASTAAGYRTFGRSYGEFSIGTYNTDYTAASTSAFNANDRVFAIGNGTGASARSNAITVLKNGNAGFGIDVPKSKVQVSNGDVYIDNATNGVIMKSPDGNCWRMTVDNTGTPVFTAITCP